MKAFEISQIEYSDRKSIRLKSEHDVFNFQECCIKEPGFVSILNIHFYICSLYMNTNIYRFLFLLYIYIYIQIFSSNISEYI